MRKKKLSGGNDWIVKKQVLHTKHEAWWLGGDAYKLRGVSKDCWKAELEHVIIMKNIYEDRCLFSLEGHAQMNNGQ